MTSSQITQKIRSKAAANLVGNPETATALSLLSIYSHTAFDADQQITGLSYDTTLTELKAQTEAVKNGDTATIEAILACQVQLLHHGFCRYLARGIDSEEMNIASANYHVAMKMQEQCRKTASTIAAMKQPRQTAFIKQITQTQINQAPENFLHDRSNEMLGGDDIGSRLDYRAFTKAVRNDPEMETLGAYNRAPYRRR